MSDPQQTVFLVDDDRDIRSSLTRALEKRGYAVQTFSSAQAFLDVYTGEQRGCLILDFGMPGMNGLELQAHLSEAGLTIPIIFITGHGGIPESVQAMKGGAIDFLEKPFPQDILVERVEEAFAADIRLSELARRAQDAQDRFARLTSRELQIAGFIVQNPSSTSSKEIGRSLDISPRTVDHHRARILEKLEIKSLTELVDLAGTARVFDLPR